MILAIDIGNTNIVMGCIDRERTHFIERLSTIRTKTELEYAMDIMMLFKLYRIRPEEVEGGIISSVVPQITHVMKLAAEKILKEKVLVVGPGIKSGLNILMDQPATLGSDLVVGAVAALAEYPAPLIVIDMGTATTICALDRQKRYIGGVIMPGVYTALDSLTANASQLSGIGLDAPGRVIGKNTIECMKSGVIYGNAACIDGMIERMEEELGEKATVVATGGLAGKIIPHCRHRVTVDDSLLLKGMQIIYDKNKG